MMTQWTSLAGLSSRCDPCFQLLDQALTPQECRMEMKIKAQEEQDAALQQGVGFPTKGGQYAYIVVSLTILLGDGGDDRANCYLKLFILGLIVSVLVLGTCGILCIASNGRVSTSFPCMSSANRRRRYMRIWFRSRHCHGEWFRLHSRLMLFFRQ
eukprot:756211-Hanusia_phi.AAC.11